jgi:hypothetical protein
MVLGASLSCLALSVGSIVSFGHAVSSQMLDLLTVCGTISAFTSICWTEAAVAFQLLVAGLRRAPVVGYASKST